MALSDFRLKALKPVDERRFDVADEHGLYIEVLPTGSRVWRYRYLLHGRREKVTVGPYPKVGVSEARKRRFAYSQMEIEAPMLTASSSGGIAISSDRSEIRDRGLWRPF